MKLADFTGKLNYHDEYLKVLKLLEKTCKYIEYVLIDEDDTIFVEKFEKFIVSVKKKNTWWGTKSAGESKVVRLRSSKEIFNYMEKFETFCIYVCSDKGDVVERTNFGMNDIAFFDDGELPLLYTTTHEGEVMVREDVKRLLERKHSRNGG